VDVALLEAQEAGFGGSGRNAGHCTPTFTYFSLPELRRRLGEPWAERLIHRQTRANDRVASMVERYQIQCEWQQNGYVMAANRPGAMAAIERKVRDYNAVGAKTRVIGRDEAEALTGSPRFHGGWFHSEGGHLNPLGYARGLARALIHEGGTIHTASPATGVERQGGKWLVHTPKGGVMADKVIFTTGAYTVGGWPRLDQSFKIMKVFVAATQPLPPETRRTVMPNNTTMNDGRGDFYVYKYDAAGRIVASMFPMGARGRDMAFTRQLMTDRLKWLHPQIKEDIRWEYFWFGELDMPEILDLIFAPGFSTAEQITGLSGRGVGMDVVRRGIEGIRGKVEVESVPGQGTSFTLYVPLTLAIIEGLLVGVGEERYIVPSLSVRESFRPLPGTVTTVHGRGEVVPVRGRLTPLLRLGRHLGTATRTTDPTEGIVVVVESGQDVRCLLVDELLGKQEVVIKSLGDTFRSQPAFAGAAILGDGRVGLILDPAGIVNLARHSGLL